uniref:Uncharacterized protein n=1 Tax=Knipowitschia caucasica TaxID=637954 RepID=A0AAV2MTU5_KNICA
MARPKVHAIRREPQRPAGRERPRTAAINKSNLSREEQSFLRALLRKAREKRPDTADVFAVSVSDETNDDYPYHLNDDLSVQQSEDTYFDPHVLRDLQDKTHEWECPSTINCDPPFHQFIGDLQQKGTYGKLYLPVTLEDQWEHKALVDTAADISLIADYLFGKLQSLAREAHRDLKTQPCDLEIRPYSQVNTTIRKMALMRLTVGPMTLVHPVYISPFNAHPLLLGQDLLNRLKPIIDFQPSKDLGTSPGALTHPTPTGREPLLLHRSAACRRPTARRGTNQHRSRNAHNLRDRSGKRH